MANKFDRPPVSRIINVVLDLGDIVEVEADGRSRGELLEDRRVKFFEDVATKGATIPAPFIQKDLERITVKDGYYLADYVREFLKVGQSAHLEFYHVEKDVKYFVTVELVKVQDEEKNVPCMLFFKEMHIHKYVL